MDMSDGIRRSGPTSSAERRLIRAARRADRAAQAELLRRHEPMVRHVARCFRLPGGDSDDLEQQVRLAILDAARDWDPKRRVPFRAFAWICAVRAARLAVRSALAGKHGPINQALALTEPGPGGLPLAETIADTTRPDDDPHAKAIAREELERILARLDMLSPFERDVLALSLNGREYWEIAARLETNLRAVNNALQRARRKLHGLPPRT
jgi:RNA polymerase sporulation-specific sigma factor